MAKAILMSIKPKYVSMILNEIKTLEIRKRFPIDYVGWVYIYCTKGKPTLKGLIAKSWYGLGGYFDYEKLNGKVVARFWCDKVEEIKRIYLSWNDKIFAWETETFAEGEIENKACLSNKELRNYLAFKQIGYAIHITKLEIFDEPKEISEFRQYTGFNFNCSQVCKGYKKHETRCLDPYNYCPYLGKKLTRAPESYCYVEADV